MEMICFEITLDTLQYAQGLGALTIWGIISYTIFKWNLGKYFSFKQIGHYEPGEIAKIGGVKWRIN